jgi:hypothetical protein
MGTQTTVKRLTGSIGAPSDAPDDRLRGYPPPSESQDDKAVVKAPNAALHRIAATPHLS